MNINSKDTINLEIDQEKLKCNFYAYDDPQIPQIEFISTVVNPIFFVFNCNSTLTTVN